MTQRVVIRVDSTESWVRWEPANWKYNEESCWDKWDKASLV